MKAAVAAIILAAGASTRMGEAKALLPASWGRAGDVLLSHIARLLHEAGADPIVAVIGPPHGPAIRRHFAAPPQGLATGLPQGLSFVENPDPSRGMLTSVQEAIRALPPQVSGTLVWPVDIPLVRPDTVRAILALAGAQTGDQIVVPVHDGKSGHPLWLPRRLFPAVLALSAAVGLRQLKIDHAGAIRLCPVDDAGILRDLDTRADLSQAIEDRGASRFATQNLARTQKI